MEFTHLVSTGTGWIKATLALVDDDRAWAEIDFNWADQGHKRYRIHFAHEQLSPLYGVLYLKQIERYEPPESQFAIVEVKRLSDLVSHSDFPRYTDDPEMDNQWQEMYNHVTFEYI